MIALNVAIHDDDPGGFTQRGAIFSAGTPYCHDVKEHDDCARLLAFAQLYPTRKRGEVKDIEFLAAVLNTTPDLWMNAQRNVDVYDVRQKLKGWKPKRVFNTEN